MGNNWQDPVVEDIKIFCGGDIEVQILEQEAWDAEKNVAQRKLSLVRARAAVVHTALYTTNYCLEKNVAPITNKPLGHQEKIALGEKFETLRRFACILGLEAAELKDWVEKYC